jgi:hypothetical protein
VNTSIELLIEALSWLGVFGFISAIIAGAIRLMKGAAYYAHDSNRDVRFHKRKSNTLNAASADWGLAGATSNKLC